MKLICDIILVSSCVAVIVRSQQPNVPPPRFPNRHQFGAGNKEPADFDCPEEFGYFPHATDCTHYYACVFGGALLESCTGGLVYSRELQTCDWPRNAGCNLTGEAPVEKKLGGGFSTVKITDSRTEKSPSKSTIEDTRKRPFVQQQDKRLGQEGFDSGFTLRPNDFETRLLRGDGRKIDGEFPRVQDIEERFESERTSNPAQTLRPVQDEERFPPSPAFKESTEVFSRPQNPPQFDTRQQEPNNFQSRPQEAPRTKAPSTPKPTKAPAVKESGEIEEYYEYLYDEFGNPVFEEESGEIITSAPTRPPTTITTERSTTTERPTTPSEERTSRTTTQFTTTSTTPRPVSSTKRVRSGTRGTMKFSETSAASAGTRIQSEEQTPNTPKPSKKGRPTLKPVGELVVSSKFEPVDVSKFSPWRYAPVFETPEPDTPAEKCKADKCQLPDCFCGGKEVPGSLEPEELPQIVLLTFDDSVNDLNKELYKDLFEKGRLNPNGCPIQATFYVSHEWTDYSQVQNLYSDGHEIASHTVSHSFGEQFSTKKWARETAGQRDIMTAYAGVKSEDVRGMRAPFLSVGGNKMFKMLYDLNFTYDSSMPVYENKPPSYPYTLDYKIFHDCMIPPCPTKSYPGVWEVPMVMWQDLNGGRCSMGDGCSNPPDAEGVYKMLVKNFERHYTTNRAPFPLYYHAAWFTTPHHKEGFQAFLDTLVSMDDVWVVTNWQLVQWMREPTSLDKIKDFEPFKCSYPDRPKKCSNPKVCNLWHKSGVRYMKSCQPCPEAYPWTGKTGVKNSILERYLADDS